MTLRGRKSWPKPHEDCSCALRARPRTKRRGPHGKHNPQSPNCPPQRPFCFCWSLTNLIRTHGHLDCKVQRVSALKEWTVVNPPRTCSTRSGRSRECVMPARLVPVATRVCTLRKPASARRGYIGVAADVLACRLAKCTIRGRLHPVARSAHRRDGAALRGPCRCMECTAAMSTRAGLKSKPN
jgi:hypothetical protein